MHGPSTSDHIGPALLRHQDFHRGSPQDSPGAALGLLERARPSSPRLAVRGAPSYLGWDLLDCASLINFIFFPQILPARPCLQLRLSLLYLFFLFSIYTFSI